MFWSAIIALILVALAILLPPLLRQTTLLQDDRQEQNITIAKQQLAELDEEFKQGRIEEIAYQASKSELEQALYNNLQEEEKQTDAPLSGLNQKNTAIAIAIFVPVVALGLYLSLGNSAAILESSANAGGLSAKQQKQLASIDQMVGTLEAKLKADPNNLQGWIMLGRTYMVLKRYPDAVQAYESANKMQANDPQILLSMADALASVSKGKLTGRPEKLIKQALQADPNNQMGLWLAGIAAEQRGANAEAIVFWKKLEAMLAPNSADRKEIAELISKAGGTATVVTTPPAASPIASNTALVPQAATVIAPPMTTTAPTQTVAPVGQAIIVKVSLSEALKAQVKPEDLVFIYAKAVTGPPMPLAAVRKQVKDLPLEIRLDDSMAMMPQMRISAFPEVKVGARVSLTGTPQAQTGDLFAEQSPVKIGASIALEINQIVGQ
jgi:cytochrome c-type biogenesis protein CcmH